MFLRSHRFFLNSILILQLLTKDYRKIPVSENLKKKTFKQFPEDWRACEYFLEFHPPFQSLVAGDDGKLEGI